MNTDNITFTLYRRSSLALLSCCCNDGSVTRTVASLTADQSQHFPFPALGLALYSVTTIFIVTIFRDLPLLPAQLMMEPHMYRILKGTYNSRVAVRHLVVQTLHFQNGGCLPQIPSQVRHNSLQTWQCLLEGQLNVSDNNRNKVYVLSRTQQCFIALVATSFGRYDYHQAKAVQN